MAIALAGLTGCAVGSPEGPAPVAAQWMMVADPALALVDVEKCDGLGDCATHPNPLGCDSLELEVSALGELCGTCTREGTTSRHCGGILTGLPYQCQVLPALGQSCVRCIDMYGNARVDQCGGVAAPTEDTADLSCRELARRDGTTCEVCVNPYGVVVRNACDSTGLAQTETIADDGSFTAGGCATPHETRHEGQVAFTRALNTILIEAELSTRETSEFTAPVLADEPTGRGGVDHWLANDLSTWCGQAWAGEEEGGDVITDGSWYREGRPRCARMVFNAMHRIARETTACQTSGSCETHFAEGLAYEAVAAYTELESMYDCIGSPIVLDLDDNGISTTATGTRFDMSGAGFMARTAWIAPGDALLARDRNGDGRISSVTELFGDVSADAPVADGFDALRLLDANGDGIISPEDPAFAELLLWRDDGDGVSEAAELVSLGSEGIVRLELNAVRADSTDENGSLLSLWSRFVRADGESAAMCDVFFSEGGGA